MRRQGHDFITKHAIPRRTVLRGLGASLALPLLDGMVRRLRRQRPPPAGPPPGRGLRPERHGDEELDAGTPPATEFEFTGFAFSPTLKPLEPFRDQLVVMAG